MPGFYILLWPQTLIELSAATLKENNLQLKCDKPRWLLFVSLRSTRRGPRESHMGIPGEDRWAGRRFPLQVTQYQRNSIYSMFKPVLPGGKRYPTHVHQQSSAGSLSAAAAVAFCCGGKSSSFNVENRRRFTINRFFGFSLLCDRLHPPQYGSGANTRGDHTQWVTHATPNVEHDHRWMWRHSTISMESHTTICCSFIAVPKPICSSGWCAEQHCILGNKGNGEEANYKCSAGAKCRAANYPGLEPNVGIGVLGVKWGEEQVKQIKEIKEIKKL